MSISRIDITLFVLIALFIAIPNAVAQQGAPPGMTIAEAVEAAVRIYPSITVSQEQINVAASGFDLARTAYLPRLDSTAQVNRATRNNVVGLLLPQGSIPSISEPVLG